MWHFRRLYQSMAIEKKKWIIVSLSHLYNAARHIGGLDVCRPDLEFIIESRGKQRIFIGDPPMNPNDFRGRLAMAMCVSARQLAKDYRSRKWKKVTKETRAKRGLMPHFPLQERIKDYYGPNHNDNRWIRLHNIFAHMFKDKNTGTEFGNDGVRDSLRELENTFTSIAASFSPQKPSRKHRNRRKSPRVTTPDFASLRSEHARLLLRMKNRLRDDELHFEFDYLGFYRRAFAFIIHIRGAVLHDSEQELARLDSKKEEPSNFELLVDLFQALKIQPKDNSVKDKGDEVSRDVIAIGQLQHISKILGELIKEEGRAELDKVESGLRRWWDAVESVEPVEPDEPVKPVEFVETVELVEPIESVKPSYPEPSVVKRRKSVYHHFTYASIVSRKRRVVILRTPNKTHLTFTPPAKGFPHRLVGKKKRRVAFACFGGCSMTRACLGLESKTRLGMKDPEIWDGLEETDIELTSDEWMSDSDLFHDTMETRSDEAFPMPGAFPEPRMRYESPTATLEDFFSYEVPTIIGAFPKQ